MTQEEKELLLKDLCARLPYHPKGHVVNACNGAECDEWLTCATFTMFTNITNNCRLYLRPMSSMTEEEKKEFIDATDGELRYSEVFDVIKPMRESEDYCASFVFYLKSIDWLNTHHFDYRGLIPMGLAIEATEGMYN